MGNNTSRLGPDDSQPDASDTRTTTISRRGSRLNNRIPSLRSITSRYELPGDSTYNRIHELPAGPTPEMAMRPRSTSQFAATYLQAEDTRRPPPGPAELSTRMSINSRDLQLPELLTGRPQTQRSRHQAPLATARQLQSPPTALNSPPHHQQTPQFHNNPAQRAQLAGNIASISHLMREMYSLDLRIYGTQNSQTRDQSERNGMIKEANKMFQQIKRTLDQWDGEREWWTVEERGVLDVIRRVVEEHTPKRRGTSRA
jgi:hypothetical protein